MKKLITLLFLMIALTVSAQNVSFKADITQMVPMKYPPQNVLSGFCMELKDDSVTVHLPYIGDVYNPTFSNDGLNFTEPCKDLKIKTKKKKGETEINFKVRHDIVNYTFRVTLYDNDNIYVYMQPSNAESCTYSGEILKE